jgi:hypothetical protein
MHNPLLFYTLFIVPEPVPQPSTPKQEPEQNLKISKLYIMTHDYALIHTHFYVHNHAPKLAMH